MAVIKHDVELGDKVSGPAKSAASAVAGVSREMTVLSKALTSAQDKMTKAAAVGNVSGFRKASTDVANLTATLGPLQAEHKRASLQAAANAKFSEAAAFHAKAHADAAAKAGGAVKELGEATEGASVSGAGWQAQLAELTGGLSVLVEAAGAVGLVFGAIVIAGAAFAIKMSEAKNASLSLWTALGKGEITGAAVDDMLDDLRASTGLTKDSLAPLTEGFLRMGITGKDALEGLTKAAASAEAMAKGGGEAFTKLYQQAKVAGETGQKLSLPFKKLENQLISMGLNVDDLAAQMGMSGTALTAGLKAGTIDAKKFGDAMQDAILQKGAGPLQTMANSSANLGKLLQEYIGDLFEDMGKDIAPFMAEIKSLFSILDSKANPSGEALKAGIGGFFKEVFATATKVVPYVKHFLLDLVILGLKAYIAVKPIVKSFNEWRNSAAGMKTISTVLGYVGTVLLTVAAVIGVAVVAFLGLWAIMVGIGVVIWAFIAAVLAIPQMAGAAIADFFGKAPQLAADFVMGLVDGIANGGAAVVGAVKGLASGAVGAFKNTLGIASPSKVMAEMGGHMGAGLEGGLEAASPGVAAAAGSMAGAGAAGAAASSGGGGGGGGGGANLTFAPGSIVINGAGKDVEELSEEMLSLVWEKLALQGAL